MILDKVNYPEDLKKLNIDEKKELAEELRDKANSEIIDIFLNVANRTDILLSFFDTSK